MRRFHTISIHSASPTGTINPEEEDPYWPLPARRVPPSLPPPNIVKSASISDSLIPSTPTRDDNDDDDDDGDDVDTLRRQKKKKELLVDAFDEPFEAPTLSKTLPPLSFMRPIPQSKSLDLLGEEIAPMPLTEAFPLLPHKPSVDDADIGKDGIFNGFKVDEEVDELRRMRCKSPTPSVGRRVIGSILKWTQYWNKKRICAGEFAERERF